ncbi:ATP-binding protein [bacterium]|nr:ATP-binding protein [bacterium]
MKEIQGVIKGSNPVKINSDKDIEIKIEIPTKAYFMSGIRDFTLQMIKDMTDFSENWAYRFQSVVDELCNNAIEHGSDPDSFIKIKFIAVPDKHIKIQVEDFGKKENPITAQEILEKINKTQQTDIKDLGLRGRGLAFIVSKWTDKLEIKDTQNGGHIVEITKNLNDQTFKTLERSLEPNQIII